MPNTMDISIQGKDYRVACEPDEKPALEAAVQLLDGRLEDMASRTRSGGEKLVVMVALNLAHELLALQQTLGPEHVAQATASVDATSARRRIASIEAKLDAALAAQKQDALF